MPEQLNLQLESLINMEGLVNVYCVDKNNVLLNANPLQIEVLKLTCGIESEKDIFGKPLKEIYQNLEPEFLQVIYAQNAEVIQSKQAKIFYNLWSGRGVGNIKMANLKMPYFNDKNEVCGIIGVAQYLSKLTLPAPIKKLLTAREVECLDFLLENKTAKAIAEKLGLTHRTVESYLDRIKNKLACHSKAELIAKIIHYKDHPYEKIAFNKIIFE